jgi:hypothetical protein
VLFRATSPRSFTEILAPTAHALWTAAAFAAVMGVLAARRGRGVGGGAGAGLAAAVVLADLLSVHHDLVPTAARELFTLRPAALDVVRPAPFLRTYVYDYFEPGKSPRYLGHLSAYLTETPQESWPVAWLDALALRVSLYPSVLGAWSVESAFDRDRLELDPLPQRALTSALLQVEGTSLHTRLLRLGAVDFVVALHRWGFEDLKPIASLPSLFVERLLVFRVPDPLPRTYAVGGVRTASSLTEELRALADPSFDPEREIVLGGAASSSATPEFSGRSRIVEFRPDRVRLEAEMASAGHVVLVDAYDAGWKARVDGREAEVLRANVAFRAVAVPAGRHAVEFAYRPRSIVVGLAVSGAAILVGLAAAGFESRRRAGAGPGAASG